MGLRSQNNPIASFRDVFSATGKDAVRAAPPGAIQGITATGGVISDYAVGNNIYRAHIFTSSGTFDVSELSTAFPNDVDYLVVAGGGGGGLGSHTGAGGGGGGFRTSMPEGPGGPGTSAESKITVTAQPYPITVGGGGAGGYSNNVGTSTQGTPSYIGPPGAKIVESTGGGFGADGSGNNGGPGGSGGGGAGDLQNTTGGPAVSPTQGYAGGNCQNSGGPTYAAGGGGGAGSAGVPGVPGQRNATNGDGGAGKRTSITGPAYSVGTPGPGGSGGYLAGGGATGSENYVTYRSGPASPGPGGGGGGNNPGNARSGTASTGGGGGGDGTGQTGSGQVGGGGGSGIVVMRYQIGTLNTSGIKASGGAISFYNGKTIHTFVASGDFTTNAGFNETVEYVIVGGGGSGGTAGPNSYGAGGGGAGQMLVGSGPVSTPSSTPHAVLIGSGGNYSSNTGIRGGIGVQSSVAFPNGTKYGNGGAGGGSNDLGGSQNGGNGSNYPSTSQGSGSGGGACKDNPTGGSGGPSALGAHPGGGIPIAPGQAGYGAAGGGGAGGAGFPGSTTPGPMAAPWTEGGGGIGLQAPTTFRNPKALAGTPGANPGGFYFAGGGAGGLYEANPDADRVGSGSAPGGGGLGGQAHGNCKGGDGLFATGAGGGGAGAINTNNVFYGGHGGSGIVIIAYPS